MSIEETINCPVCGLDHIVKIKDDDGTVHQIGLTTYHPNYVEEDCDETSERRASVGLGIMNRGATPLEHCMGLRMNIYGEDEETARRTCIKMLGTHSLKLAKHMEDMLK